MINIFKPFDKEQQLTFLSPQTVDFLRLNALKFFICMATFSLSKTNTVNVYSLVLSKRGNWSYAQRKKFVHEGVKINTESLCEIMWKTEISIQEEF